MWQKGKTTKNKINVMSQVVVIAFLKNTVFEMSMMVGM